MEDEINYSVILDEQQKRWLKKLEIDKNICVQQENMESELGEIKKQVSEHHNEVQRLAQENETKQLQKHSDTYSLERLQTFSSSVWSLRWVAKPIGYLLPRDDREEWLGDLEEIYHLMLFEGKYPIWFINLIIATKTSLLVWSAIEVHIINLLDRNSGA